MNDKNDSLKEKNLAYGGSALIEGVLMRGQESYALTVKSPENTFYKEKHLYIPLGKRIKIFGLPFVRGFIGLIENMVLSIKVLNKSAEIAFPDESEKKTSSFTSNVILFFSLLIAITIFGGIPYYLTSYLFPLNHNNNPILYNLVSGIIRLIFFFVYIYAISFFNDTKRLFGYHGAEHKTINTYEDKKELNVENVKKHSRLHPRCGTSFLFIVFLITIVVFPFFNIFLNTQNWYIEIGNIKQFGAFLQKLIQFLSHIILGLPIVSAISYELLKLSAKYKNNILVKALILPGLFFQLFTTKEPDEIMIKASIISLNMILGNEDVKTARNIKDDIKILKPKLVLSITLLPIYLII